METTNTELQPVHNTSNSVLINRESFEHAQRVAKMLSESDLVPAVFKGKIGNCVIALNMAARIGADPMMVMQNIYIVHGKPAWSSQFLIATLNACGKFSPLRYEEDDQEGGRCRAIATDKFTNEKCEGIWVSMEMADKEGWVNKSGSKWKTMPQLMRRYRAASFFTKQFAPEVSMGIQSHEEVEDTPYVEVESNPINKKEEAELDRVKQLIANCKTVDDVQKLKIQCPDFDIKLFADRIEELGGHGQ